MDQDDTNALEILQRVQAKEPSRLDSIFKRHGVAPGERTADLLKEIRQDGSNTVWLPFRPEGVHYREVVEDVAKAIDAKVRATVVETEQSVVARVVELYYEKCSADERTQLDAALNEAGADAATLAAGRAGAKAVSALIMGLVVKFGAKTVLKMVLRRLPVVLVPGLGWLMTAWTVLDVFGPAMRKTIPTVVEIALLRMEFGDD
ncbi:MAG: hypothetical protein FJ100_22245 [Deltaproteobacteria bacterium]|nr:hypothetical protein [Deltaproteobacteria bacterium]